MSKPSILTFLYKAFSPPFSTLPFLVWCFFFWCFLIHPASPLVSGAFWDSDDYIHFVRVIDWLNGQSWFDPVLHRLAPPEGVSIHYSRLAELPLAALMWPLHGLGVEWRFCAYLAACLYPLVLFGGLLVVLRWTADACVDPMWSRITAFIAIFMPFLTFQFNMGRVDHHGLAVLATLGAWGCLLRVFKDPARWIWPIGSAFFLAFGVSVALEVLVWLLCFSFFVGALVVLGGRPYAKAGALYGVLLFLFSCLFLAAEVPPSAYTNLNPLAYSALYVCLSGLIGLVLLIASFATIIKSIIRRVVLSGVVAGGAAFLFLHSFPALLSGGPYGAVDPTLAALLFPNISEAMPKIDVVQSWVQLIVLMLPPIFGFIVAGVLVWKAKGKARVIWGGLTIALLLSLLLALFYQQRVNLYAQLFAVFPLAALLHRGWSRIAQTKEGRARFAAEIGLILLVGPLLGVVCPALLDGRSFSKGVVLFPMAVTPQPRDMQHSLWFVLNDPGYFGDRQRHIMAPLDEGAEILFHTKHIVYAAPYHTNVKGNMKGARFFGIHEPDEALKIARELSIDLVILPKDVPPLYKNQTDEIVINEDGEEGLSSKASFAEQLAAGRVPDWLKPYPLPFMQGYRLFEVVAPKSVAGK